MYDKYVPMDRLRPFAETISATFELMRNAFKPLMILLLTVAGPIIVLAAIGLEYTERESPYAAILAEFGFGQSSSTVPLWMFYVAIVIDFCADLVASVVVVIYFLEYHRLHRLPTVPEIRIALQGVWTRAFAGWFARTMLTILGLVVLVVPGIYIGIALSIMIVAQFAESLTVGASIKRSLTLIKGDWWWAFFYLVLMFLCALFVGWVVDLPGSALFLIEVMTKDTGSEATTIGLQIVGSIVRVAAHILTTCITALASTAIVVLYYREVERTEGSGLLGRVSAIGGGDVSAFSTDNR